jgi:hypothetical protein
LSEAIGESQLTAIRHANGSVEETMISDGQLEITGGVSTAINGEQQIAPPFLLFPAITLKLPYVFPTYTSRPPHVDLIWVSCTPLTVNVTKEPTNLSFGMDPVNVNVPPGFTIPENTIPSWSDAVITLATD